MTPRVTTESEDNLSKDVSESGAQHVGLDSTCISLVACVPPVHTESRTRLLFLCLHSDVDVSEFVHTAGQIFDEICTKSAEEVAEDFTYEELSKKVSDGNFTHAFVVPPGGTFTSALRGNTPSEVYGWKSIRAVDKNKVRIEILLVIRAAEIIAELHALCRPWLFENNEDSEPNVFMLPEVRKLLLLPGASVTRLAHCRDAAHRNAGSRILGNVSLHQVDVDSFTHSENYFSSALRKDCSSMCKHWAFPILRLTSPGKRTNAKPERKFECELGARSPPEDFIHCEVARRAAESEGVTRAGRQAGVGGFTQYV